MASKITQISQQNTTKVIEPEWVPSPKQLAVLEAAKEGGYGRSISAICMEAHVDRTRFYAWMKEDADFRKMWEELPRKILFAHIPAIYQALITKAQSGDVAAIKLALEISGEYVPAQKVEHSGKLTLEDLVTKAWELVPQQESA